MTVLYYLQHILNLLTFQYAFGFDNHWDKELAGWLASRKPVTVSKYTVTFQVAPHHEVKVWVGDRFHSFGHQYCVNDIPVPNKMWFRPRFKTMLRLYQLHRLGGYCD